MISGATYEQSLASRKHYVLPNGTGYWKSDFIKSAGNDTPSPQAFLVEQDPSQVILPHFHEQNQFQIIVKGGGTLGRTVVAPITVHYAGAYTGYGPITSGAEGLWYFTLRPMMDSGALFVHESRDKMKPGAKKHYHSAPLTPTPASGLANIKGPDTQVLNADPEGPTVEVIKVPPRGQLVAADSARGGGRYLLVTSGSLSVNDAQYGKWGCLWMASGAPARQIVAGEAGLEVLLLEFPRTDYRVTYSGPLQKYSA